MLEASRDSRMVSKEKAVEKLQAQINSIKSLRSLKRGSSEFKKWIRDTQVAIEHIFGNKSRHITDFNNIRYSLGVLSSSTPDSRFQEAYISGLNNAEAILISMCEEINEYWNEDKEVSETNLKDLAESPAPANNKVFVIHGHDSGTKETVARFLSKIGLEPIILHEQASQGKTIIEKFEQYADVSYAVALLTPDDVGNAIRESENTKPRARQNVIFEFGYFIGKLGRKHVAGLIKGDVEVPSDYSGVVYLSMDDNGAWKFLLIKELKAVGFNVDANKAV